MNTTQGITEQNKKSQQKMIIGAMLLLSIFILIFFTKDMMFTLNDNMSQKDAIEAEIEEQNKVYEEVSKVKSDLDTGKIDNAVYNKYLISFNENEILSYFYTYSQNNAGKMKINSITLDAGKVNEVGFHEGKINLGVTFINEQAMLDTLTFLTNNDKYNFFVHEFTYPVEGMNQPFNVQIPLKVLYK